MTTTRIKSSGSGTAGTPALPPDTFSRWRTLIVSGGFALLAGLIASLCATLVMGILRLWIGVPTPVELFGDFVLVHIDVNTFIHLLISFGSNSKRGPLGLALLAMVGIGTLLGIPYALLVRLKLPVYGYRPGRREWFIALGFSLVMTAVAILLFWQQIRQNAFGWPIDTERWLSSLGLFADFATYSFILCWLYRVLLPKVIQPERDAVVARRRQLLARSGAVALGVGAGLGTFGAVQAYLKNYTWYDGMKTSFKNHIIHPITPNDEHYVVTQNAVDPMPDTNLWRLEVTGLVQKPGSYSYEELKKLPSDSRAITLECIANGPADHLIGNAIWHGVPLRALLEQHGGAQATARYVAFYAVDGYTISLPLQEVLDANALLAWNMNGVPLPTKHGYPLRVLIPGRYGEENPKWLTRVELTSEFVPGLYSSQGWYNGPLHTTSRIDNPYKESVMHVGQSVDMSGIAFAGNRGIQKVEVSVDNGISWRPATLDPAISPDSWVFWKANWQPGRAGTYTLAVRATDGTGTVQTATKQGTVPNGATGYDTLLVTVA
ncbi:molybdopterin-dependent oxidoreductase [Dictyobacter arantiisoli]|uniref:Molybdopterin-binding oxidoreductase n=1 Tax=Dictyobacter arantiisoli TaxID=2014874 RepID=A0A5A5TGB2_9CHLR|nr:molybdopterin-dependent oxidoreductase [Dictyobacter arantiisoli]GCF10265.1 hypothetical protein KDI_38290 [Dictyobacter arantiisoli]